MGAATKDKPRLSGGFTLAESLLAAVVLAMAVLAVCLAMSSGHMQSEYAGHGHRGMTLAEELMERILKMPYGDPQGVSSPGPESGETAVSGFDNADDFHGYTEPAGGLRDVSGQYYPSDYQEFSRRVTARYESRSIPGLEGPIPGLWVVVEARDQRGQTFSVTRFIPEPVEQ